MSYAALPSLCHVDKTTHIRTDVVYTPPVDLSQVQQYITDAVGSISDPNIQLCGYYRQTYPAIDPNKYNVSSAEVYNPAPDPNLNNPAVGTLTLTYTATIADVPTLTNTINSLASQANATTIPFNNQLEYLAVMIRLLDKKLVQSVALSAQENAFVALARPQLDKIEANLMARRAKVASLVAGQDPGDITTIWQSNSFPANG